MVAMLLLSFLTITGCDKNSEARSASAEYVPGCLTGQFQGPTGELKYHVIPLETMGRFTLGDLDSDDYPDFVVANRNKLTAYDICGKVLWRRNAATNFDYTRHYFWNWSSYGFIGDADGDGRSEYLHIGSDWRTLFVRDGITGEVHEEIALPEGKWMYAALAQRPGESGETATRIIATSIAYYDDIRVAAYDIRSGDVNEEWTYHGPASRVGNFAYIPPAIADIDGADGDEVVFGSVALNQDGEEIWAFSAAGMGIGGLHTLSVRDIDSRAPGLEAVYSIYDPRSDQQPSLLSYSYSSSPDEHWRAFSPHKEKHPHQHAVGDFNLSYPGLETVARNRNGFDHWMVDKDGAVVRPNLRVDPGWRGDGEIVTAVEWDDDPGTELLYIERHLARHEMPRLRVTSPHTNENITPVFSGGDGSPIDWYGATRDPDDDNGPYEGAAHAVDVFGDGREEIITWGGNEIHIYYNSGDAGVPGRWGNADYMKRKKIWCNVYNPR